MVLARWTPFRETLPLRDMMNQLFEYSVVPQQSHLGQATSQPMDVYTEGDKYSIEMALPGFPPDAIDVSCDGNTIAISGAYPQESDEQQGRHYLLRERTGGRFQRTVTLPTDLDADKAEA